MTMRWMTAAVVVLVLIGWAPPVKAQSKPAEAVVGKVAVSAKGAVWLDGKATTVDALRERLAELKKRNGVVWYYRESAGAEPPPQAMQVMKLIIDARLPISMSTKPDYSDVLLPDGSTRPPAQR
jgi:biopolymer transport protein ExbD